VTAGCPDACRWVLGLNDAALGLRARAGEVEDEGKHGGSTLRAVSARIIRGSNAVERGEGLEGIPEEYVNDRAAGLV
jgi:hypothetical protein